MRPLWRWWEEKDGVELWCARVEVRPGEWTDIDQARYDVEVREPYFWSLPLKEEYQAAIVQDPIREVLYRRGNDMHEGLMGAFVIGGAALFAVLILVVAVTVLLN